MTMGWDDDELETKREHDGYFCMVGQDNALAFRCTFRGRQLQDSNKDEATEFKHNQKARNLT